MTSTLIRLLIAVSIFGAAATVVAARQGGEDEVQLRAAISKETVEGDLKGAIALYEQIVKTGSRAVAARAQVRIGQCYEKLGDAEARKAYEKTLRDFADQADAVATARARLAALAGQAGPERPRTMGVRRIWEGPEVDLEGGVSPNGRYVSFIDWTTGDLAIRDLAKGESRRLTKNGTNAYSEFADFAAFSPDGRQLVYGWCTKDGTYDLRVVGIDGSGERVLTRSKEFNYFLPLEWSRDGRYVLSLVMKDRNEAIALISASDGSVRVVRSLGSRSLQGASLSPDGRWIAYAVPRVEDPAQYDIHLAATDGSRDLPLVEHPSRDLAPVWTPDGRQVLFVSDRSGTLGFWMVTVVDGQAQGPPRLVKPDVGRVRPLGFGADGSLYYGLIAGTGDVYEMALEPKSGRPAAAPSIAVKHYVGFNGTPDYSPDGQFLACISVRGNTSDLIPGNRSLVIHSLKTGEEREFPFRFAPGWELKWSPDSRFVLVPGRDINWRILTYQVDVRTGAQTAVSEIGGMTNQHGSQRGWFPDQKSVYIVARAPQDEQGKPRSRILRQDLASATTEDLFLYRSDQFELRSVVLSPGGDQFGAWRLDLASSSASLILIPATGGEPRVLLSMGDEVYGQLHTPLRGLAWSPDGRHLLYTKRAVKSGATDLWRIAVAGGEPERIGPLVDDVFDLVVHPSGQRIAFSTRHVEQEVWVMENFLPAATPAAASPEAKK
jgi:Tol biopolymer transport system component